MLHVFLPKAHKTLKYHLVTAEPSFAVKTIDWVHQTGPRTHSILLSVTDTLCLSSLWQCRSLYLEWKSMDSMSVLMGYLTISTKCWRVSDTLQMTIFVSGRQHRACNTVQLLQHS